MPFAKSFLNFYRIEAYLFHSISHPFSVIYFSVVVPLFFYRFRDRSSFDFPWFLVESCVCVPSVGPPHVDDPYGGFTYFSCFHSLKNLIFQTVALMFPRRCSQLLIRAFVHRSLAHLGTLFASMSTI
jgi:hypothetical protein